MNITIATPARASLVILAAALCISGCASHADSHIAASADASASSSSETTEMSVIGTWLFSSFDGQPMVPTHRPATLGFDDQRAFGMTGCNRFSGGYSLSGDTLQMQPLAMTRMACLGAVAAQEGKLSAMFGEPIKVTLSDNGQRLTLKSASHQAELFRE